MKSKKRILIVLPSFQDPGGVAAYYNSLVPHLQNHDISISSLEVGSTKGQGNIFYPFADQLRFRKSIAINIPDLVHINPSLDLKSLLRDGLLVYQAKLKQLPVIIFFHGWSENFEHWVSKRLLWFFKKTFGKADAFIVLGEQFKNTLLNWGTTSPIYITTTTVDEALLEGFSIKEKIKRIQLKEKINILYLARLVREKGAFETVDAVSLLVKKGFRVTLSIAGDGPIHAELVSYVDSQGLSNHVKFLGYVSGKEKIKSFLEHDIYCFPTYYGEGLPTSVLEALSFGLPVITRPVAGLADIFQEGEMGFLCQGKTSAEIANALEKLITNRPLMLQMSEYNYAFAKDHFMASVVAKNISEIYRNTLISIYM